MFLPLEVQDVVWMAQMNCLDLNPWNARGDDIDHPDELRIDLDPADEKRIRGYQLFGRTPVPIWDRERRIREFEGDLCIFRPGDRLRFVPCLCM